MALEPLEAKMLEDTQRDVREIKKILLGNGEIGLLERVRDTESCLNSNKVLTLSVKEEALKAVKELAKNVDARMKEFSSTISPLDKAAQRKKIIVSFLQTVGTVLITIAPVLWATAIYAQKVLEKLNAVVPLETIIPK